MLLLICSLLLKKKGREGRKKDTDVEGLLIGPEGIAAPEELPAMFYSYRSLNFPYLGCDHMVQYLD